MKPSLSKLKAVAIQGTHIDIEPLTTKHAEEIYEAGQDERIWKYMSRGPFVSAEDARAFIVTRLSGASEVPFAVRHKSTGKVVGAMSYLDINGRNRSIEIGWIWINPEYWGTVVPLEQQFLLARYAFDEFDTGRVWFKTDDKNVRAKKALELTGIKKEGVLRKHQYVRDGYIRDSAVYSVIEEEWPKFKKLGETFILQGGRRRKSVRE